MIQFVRLDPLHYLYMVEFHLTIEEADAIRATFKKTWPEATLLIAQAHQFIDAMGTATVVQVSDVR